MIVDENGNLNLAEMELDEDTKYYVQNPARKYMIIEVQPELFKSYLVNTAKNLTDAEAGSVQYQRAKNNIEYMKKQLSDDVNFYLDLVSMENWIYKP